MSVDLMAAALWLDMEPSAKLILVALCDRADFKTGKCWPGRDELSARTSLSPKTVTERIKGLEADGWVKSKRGNFRRGETTTRWVRVARILAEGEQRRQAFRARFDGIDNDDFPEPFEAAEQEELGLGVETTPSADKRLGVIDGVIGCNPGNDQVKSTALLGEAASLVTVREPSDQPSTNRQSPADEKSLPAQRTASSVSVQPGEKFFSPGPDEELEIPEPDWSAADLPPRLRLLSSRLCDACGEAFTAVEGQEICGECLAAYVASRRDARSAPGVPS